MPYVENLNEFARRQRCKPLFVNARWLFPNGAQSDGVYHYEPPTDRVELTKLRAEFEQARLDELIADYRQIYTNVKRQLEFHKRGAGPMPAEGWEEALKELSAAIDKQQALVDELRAALPQTENLKRFVDLRNQQRQAAAESLETLKQLPTY